MLVAGIDVSRALVTELVSILRGECYFNVADTFERALEADADGVRLTVRERTAVLDVLDDPPAGLEQLRAVLLTEHEWRLRHGLVSGRR